MKQLRGLAVEAGGSGRNRTGVDGFAGRCITTLLPSRGSGVEWSSPSSDRAAVGCWTSKSLAALRNWSGKRGSNSRP